MQLGLVVGHATATVKHPTLAGWPLKLVQPLNARGEPDGDPQLAVDGFGSRFGDRVLLTSDGGGVREMIGSRNTPIRWAVMGLSNE